MSGSAIPPTKLGMASLRQTNKLRKKTGHQRMESCGGAHTDGITWWLRIMRSP
jgi:hypothetical protein